MEKNATIEGSGIFGKKADKWMEKKRVKKFVYKVGTALKPLAEEGINAAAAYAGTMGVPSSITDLAKDTATGYMNDPGAYQSKKGRAKLLKQASSVGLDAASPYLSQAGIDVSQVKAAGKMAKDMRRASRSAPTSYSDYDMRGQATDAFLSQLQGYMDQRAARKAAPPPSTNNAYDYMDQDAIVGNGLEYGLYAGRLAEGFL